MEQQQGDGCLGVVRAVVLVAVVPVRFVWEVLAAVGRAVGLASAAGGRWLYRWVLRPVGVVLGWLVRYLVAVPLVTLGRYVFQPGWMLLVVSPSRWLWRWVLVPAGNAVMDGLIAVAEAIAWALSRSWRGGVWCAVGVARGLVLVRAGLLGLLGRLAAWVRSLLAPVWRAVAAGLVAVAEAIAWVLSGVAWCAVRVGRGLAVVRVGLLWLFDRLVIVPLVAFARWVLMPIGRGVLWVGAVIRDGLAFLVVAPLAWLWRTVLYPLLRMLGRAVVWAWRQAGRLWRVLVVRPCRWVWWQVAWSFRWVRREVWWPVKAEVRRAVAEVRRVAGEVRRALLG